MALGVDGREQIKQEGNDVEGKDEGDNPFENGSDVVVLCVGGTCKNDGKHQFNENKGKLEPEGSTQDTMLSVFLKCVSRYIIIYKQNKSTQANEQNRIATY